MNNWKQRRSGSWKPRHMPLAQVGTCVSHRVRGTNRTYFAGCREGGVGERSQRESQRDVERKERRERKEDGWTGETEVSLGGVGLARRGPLHPRTTQS